MHATRHYNQRQLPDKFIWKLREFFVSRYLVVFLQENVPAELLTCGQSQYQSIDLKEVIF